MTNPALSDQQRLADLPDLIAKSGRTLNGLKTDLERAQRKLDAVEARVRLTEAVRSEKNAEDRKAAHVLECESDPEWGKLTDRMTELRGMIRATTEQKDLLRREKDVLLVKLQNLAAARWEAILQDKTFTDMIGKGLLS